VVSQREPALVTPFWVRIATETSLSPGWLLIAFPAVLYPTYLLLEVLFGRGLAAAMDFGGDYETRMVLLWATVLGYVSMTAHSCLDPRSVSEITFSSGCPLDEMEREETLGDPVVAVTKPVC
jgi:hypothetical protein